MFGHLGGKRVCPEHKTWTCGCNTTEADTDECDAIEGEDRTAEHVEADIRKAMAEHAKIPPRGWQSDRQRAILRDRIDRLCDEHAALLEIEEMTSGGR